MRRALLFPFLLASVVSADSWKKPQQHTTLFLEQASDQSCSPEQQPVSAASVSRDAFYSLLQTAASKPDWPAVPHFQGRLKYLCDASEQQRTWGYCLPISASRDESKCAGADRTDLLHPFTASKPLCQASVLHLLLLDVYAELERLGGQPALVYGTLLGAVRDGGIIPFTEDVDVAYRAEGDLLRVLRHRLKAKGYHLFYNHIWRVCVAPTHPLAAKVYDPKLAAPIKGFTVPYLDLYRLQRDMEVPGNWNLQAMAAWNGSIPDSKVHPYSKVTLNGVDLDTVADARDFLQKEYGPTYMVPRKRGRW